MVSNTRLLQYYILPIYVLFITYFIENCPLSETIFSLEEPKFQDFIFIGIGLIFLIVAEIDKADIIFSC